MIGWFEWDEASQRLVVVIPPWDCVDAPAIEPSIVNRRTDAWSAKIKAMDLPRGLGALFGTAFTPAASWVPDDLLDHAADVLLTMHSPPEQGLKLAAKVRADIEGYFAELTQAGVNTKAAVDKLFSAAMLMSASTRPLYNVDLIARMREGFHDNAKTVEPHKTINAQLKQLQQIFFGAPAPKALALPQTETIEALMLSLIRRTVFSLSPVNRRMFVDSAEKVNQSGHAGFLRLLAMRLVSQPRGDIPLYAVCQPMSKVIKTIAEQGSSQPVPDANELANWILDMVDSLIQASVASTYRFTRTYLVTVQAQPWSAQLRRSRDILERHNKQGADERLALRSRWLAGKAADTAPSITLSANPSAASADTPAHTWPVDRLVRWINGPVTDKQMAGKLLKDTKQALVLDTELLAQDRNRAGIKAPKGRDSLQLTQPQVDAIIWTGIAQSAEYLRDDLNALLALVKTLTSGGGHPPAELNTPTQQATEALSSVTTTLTAINAPKRTISLSLAQVTLSAVNEKLEGLRTAIKPVQAAAERLSRFERCLSDLLLQEALTPGRKLGGVIACPMPMSQWAAVRDRFHQRYCTPVQALTINDRRTLLRSDQALALHVTGSSQSGYAFDVSVHLWQRRNDSRVDPFDQNNGEAFPAMTTPDWFDTLITCAVLHVPEKQ